MRILMVNKYARVTGGADLNCIRLAELLRSRGHEVAMLSTASPDNEFADGEFVEASVTHASREELGAPTAARGRSTRDLESRTRRRRCDG